MNGFYPIVYLENKKSEIQKTKDYITANTFPAVPLDELLKIDLVILQIESAIRSLEGLRICAINISEIDDIYKLREKGMSYRNIGKIYKVDKGTVSRNLKNYYALIESYSKTISS